MSENILQKLAAKLTTTPDAPTQTEEQFAAVLDEHFDAVSAALAHSSSHSNNHTSSPFTLEP
jgi:flagellar hook-basal body complex protein FliE